MAEIGFIGLGLMGSAMAQRLLDRGHALTVLGNRSRAGVEAATARGATEVGTAQELAAASDIVMLCMGTSEHVEARMRGADGVLAGLRPGAVVIDFGTSLPESTRALAAETAEAGGAYLDAPLGRTPAHAEEGKLNIMGAGDRAAFDRVRSVLDDLGENVFHLGGPGAGHTIKLINNFFGMTVANAMAEAFATADRAGVDRRQLFEVMGAGPLRSGMMEFVADPDTPFHDADLKHDADIVLICGKGGQAALTGKTMHDMGFTKLANAGGFPDWKEKGGPSEAA